jgi:hypothetical protein
LRRRAFESDVLASGALQSLPGNHLPAQGLPNVSVTSTERVILMAPVVVSIAWPNVQAAEKTSWPLAGSVAGTPETVH